MSKTIRRVLLCVPVLAVLGVLTLAPAVRADDPPDMTDYNAYWKVAEDPTPPDPSLDYNTYWAEVQAKQMWQDRQQ